MLVTTILCRRVAVGPLTRAAGVRAYSAEPEKAEAPEYSDKIRNIVKEITALNLFEVAELTSCLKVSDGVHACRASVQMGT